MPIGKLESKEFREIKTDKANRIKRKFANQVGKENILVRKTKSWLLVIGENWGLIIVAQRELTIKEMLKRSNKIYD